MWSFANWCAMPWCFGLRLSVMVHVSFGRFMLLPHCQQLPAFAPSLVIITIILTVLAATYSRHLPARKCWLGAVACLCLEQFVPAGPASLLASSDDVLCLFFALFLTLIVTCFSSLVLYVFVSKILTGPCSLKTSIINHHIVVTIRT